MIHYTDSLDGITPERLSGFFVGWGNPPSPEKHLEMLRGAYRLGLAVDESKGQVVGFVYALSDGVLTAFIPLLEVLPDYKGQGIGTELVRRLLESLKHLYSIDLICDPDVQPFYERLKLRPYSGMIWRNYENQSGS